MVEITVLPFFANLLTSLTILNALKESRPEVGSSSSTRDGSVINSTPIAVLFLSPPEMVFCRTDPTTVSAAFLRPRSLISSSTLSFCSYSDKSALFNLAAKVNASLGV
jgi:hypothetical protein